MTLYHFRAHFAWGSIGSLALFGNCPPEARQPFSFPNDLLMLKLKEN